MNASFRGGLYERVASHMLYWYELRFKSHLGCWDRFLTASIHQPAQSWGRDHSTCTSPPAHPSRKLIRPGVDYEVLHPQEVALMAASNSMGKVKVAGGR